MLDVYGSAVGSRGVQQNTLLASSANEPVSMDGRPAELLQLAIYKAHQRHQVAMIKNLLTCRPPAMNCATPSAAGKPMTNACIAYAGLVPDLREKFSGP